MKKTNLIQRIITKSHFKTYLEIGVQTWSSFLPIVCRNKIAVDPHFQILFRTKVKYCMQNLCSFRNIYHEETSDIYFEKIKKWVYSRPELDIVLIDWLHTFFASLKDALNSLQYLNNNGVIILHDCYPTSSAAAFVNEQFPTKEEQKKIKGWTWEWSGDVWKTVVYLRSKFPDTLDTFVLNTDYGLWIVRIKKNWVFLWKIQEIDQDLFTRIDQIMYEEMVINSENMIGLKWEEYAEILIGDISENTL